jgi:copper chaperone CopZ/Pyruvate/2-oxoacid:ferredoxin oxidoreductase delta subunit
MDKQTKTKKFQLPITGMTCESCEKHVYDALIKLNGVLQVEISYKAGTAIIECLPELNLTQIKNSIKEAGYGVGEEDDFYSIKTSGGNTWIPAYIQAIDYEKCTACGLCARVCGQNIFAVFKENGSKRVEIVNPEECLGDCHCHKVCKFGALICKPRKIH